MLRRGLHPILVGLGLAALVALPALLLSPGGGSAAGVTYTVNSPADVPEKTPDNDHVCETAPGNGVCTLRAAIQEANSTAGADTIVLSGITYTLSIVSAAAQNEYPLDPTKGDLNISESVNIVGASQSSTIIDGNGQVVKSRVLTIVNANPMPTPPASPLNPVIVNMSNLTLKGGASPNVGGGIYNTATLNLDHVTIDHNTASGLNDWGGGIYNAGDLTMTNSTLSNNVTGNHNAYGGGMYNQGNLTITDSTISGNGTYAGTSSLGEGGGLFLIGYPSTIRNTTISGNTAAVGGGVYKGGYPAALIDSTITGNNSTSSGGGIYNAGGVLGLFNDTITSNTANSDHAGGGVGGGVSNASGATLNLTDTILAYNGHAQSAQFPILYSDDCAGTLTSAGYNIVMVTSPDDSPGQCTVSGASSADPNLGPLQNNGGPTLTQALNSGSPAIDGGNPGGCTDDFGAMLATDQRGAPRAVDGDNNGSAICDIGAYELGAARRRRRARRHLRR